MFKENDVRVVHFEEFSKDRPNRSFVRVSNLALAKAESLARKYSRRKVNKDVFIYVVENTAGDGQSFKIIDQWEWRDYTFNRVPRIIVTYLNGRLD